MLNRIRVELLDANGQTTTLEAKVRRDCVEFWFQDRCRAAFDRSVLRDWLTYPDGAIIVDEVILSLSTTGIQISFDSDPTARILEPIGLGRLRERL